MSRVYLIGSLSNIPEINALGRALVGAGHDVFDGWTAGGPDVDKYWQAYEKAAGRDFREALQHPVARHNFRFDLDHLHRSDVGILVLPAGKSGHLELGWMAGKGKRTVILSPDGEPEKWDVMYAFVDAIVYNMQELLECLRFWGNK